MTKTDNNGKYEVTSDDLVLTHHLFHRCVALINQVIIDLT